MTTASIAINEELAILKEIFPNKHELTLDEYAQYFGINRKYASKHFSRKNNGKNKISHKRIGRKIFISLKDFAYWLASQKVVDGNLIFIPSIKDIKQEMKGRRGFSYKK
ncbi:MAG: helix-turn-helix domain-containing protein [Firmicutes bacterium]|nr:helix-turn-helix domain-containing protein [Bacillota bacterium]